MGAEQRPQQPIPLPAVPAVAEARSQSLAGLLRDLMAEEAAMPSINEVMTTIAGREPVDVSAEEIREMIEDGRRW
ncbi:hypothetical protein Rhe02_97170 [Rhizocola hellebori]|uniref:Antitoxin n=1 Tax=Rhizocola hellebori TaxID=1392758 RepID=A0A8J3VM67_9ACTN